VTAFDVSSARCDRDPHGCITCGDEGIVMRVLQVDDTRGLALCETAGGERSTVEIALVDAGPGDDVLVHAGTAIA
jgi:hydrogenase expression/formation protein HypC